MKFGRSRRFASPLQKLALALRDGGFCCKPGCPAPWTHCDADHIVEWDDGGLTDIENLRPLCGPDCHKHRHETGMGITRQPDGTWTVDGESFPAWPHPNLHPSTWSINEDFASAPLHERGTRPNEAPPRGETQHARRAPLAVFHEAAVAGLDEHGGPFAGVVGERARRTGVRSKQGVEFIEHHVGKAGPDFADPPEWRAWFIILWEAQEESTDCSLPAPFTGDPAADHELVGGQIAHFDRRR